MNPSYLYSKLRKPAIKSIDLPQYPDDAWDWISGGPDDDDVLDLLTCVDWMYRAVELIMISVGDIPFYIMSKRGTEIDTSADWQNRLGFWPNPTKTIQLIAAGLFSYGYAYLLREKGGGIIDKDMRYLMPRSITPVIDDKLGLTHFERRMPDGTDKKFKPKDEIVYFWLPDANVEIGHPKAWPAKAAFSAAGVLYNMDSFVAGYFKRSAINPTLLGVPTGTDQREVNKLLLWFRDVVSGVKNSFSTNVLSTDITVTSLGKGLEALDNRDLTDTAREAIATAAGIPQSMLAANAANYATADLDKKNLYDNKLIPWSQLIADVLNDQVFVPLGYQFEFRPYEMDMYQEDENERSESLVQLLSAVNSATDIESFQFAADVLGFDIGDEQQALIEAHFKRKEENAAQMQAQLQAQVASQPEEEDEEEGQPPQLQANAKAIADDLDKWQRKVIKQFGKTDPHEVSFVSDIIPADTREQIRQELVTLHLDHLNYSTDDIKTVFAKAANYRRPTDPLLLLAGELRRANDLLEMTQEA
jgi:hypothetical protein